MNGTLRSGWSYRKLNELGTIGRGKSRHRPRNDPSLYGGQYPFIQTADVKAADFYLSHWTQTYNDIGLAQSKLWDPGTLCVTIAANIAETAILKINACFPDSIVGFTADPQQADVRYIKYYIDMIKLRMQNVSKGTTQDNLSLEKLLSFDLYMPPASTQRKTADVLSAYDDLVENNLRRMAILEEMVQSLYNEWFVRFRFPGRENVRMVDSPSGLIPEGWEVVAFTDIAGVLNGGTPKTSIPGYWNGDIPFFTPKDAPTSFYVTETEKTITELGLNKCNSKLYPRNTIFITARGTVGKVVMPAVSMAMNQSCYALVGREGINQHFLFFLTRNHISQLRQNAHGAVFDTIVMETFRQLKVPRPPHYLIDAFAVITLPIFEQVLNLLKQNVVLRHTRDLLLPRLISGEVDVANLDDIKVEGDDDR